MPNQQAKHACKRIKVFGLVIRLELEEGLGLGQELELELGLGLGLGRELRLSLVLGRGLHK